METIYITRENCVLHKCEDHLIIKKKGQSIGTVPLNGVKTIVLLNSVQVTSYTMDLLFYKKIDLIYISRSGQIKGRLYNQAGGGAIIRLAQHNAFLNHELRLQLAKEMIRAKINNQIQLIKKYIRYYSMKELNSSVMHMEGYISNLAEAKTIEQIMGVEGISAKIYWDGFRHLLKDETFKRRDYRPAPDYINSALNLSYAFLATGITTCLSAQKFDLEIGFLHSIYYGRNSLTLDLMEEFRAPFADTWLLGLFNRKVLRSEHFYDQSKGYYFTEEGFQKFCMLYHEHMEENLWHKKFHQQAENLRKAVMEGISYIPYIHE